MGQVESDDAGPRWGGGPWWCGAPAPASPSHVPRRPLVRPVGPLTPGPQPPLPCPSWQRSPPHPCPVGRRQEGALPRPPGAHGPGLPCPCPCGPALSLLPSTAARLCRGAPFPPRDPEGSRVHPGPPRPPGGSSHPSDAPSPLCRRICHRAGVKAVVVLVTIPPEALDMMINCLPY